VKEWLQKETMEKRFELYQLGVDSLLMYNNKLYVPNLVDLRNLIMDEVHRIPYVGHHGY
jgi:hypothetical protein